ncbi:MAG: ribosome recycling factor [Candidatus Dormibacteria bacterium]
MDERLGDAEVRMAKAIEALHKEFRSIRTGRASPALVERLQVEYYGAMTPLQSLATISAPEARQLLIQPYDKSSIGAIDKAIQLSDLGLNPSNDGQVLRITIPALTEERRREYVKVVHRKAEDARVAVRIIRRDELEHIRGIEKDGHVSKDEIEVSVDRLQKITDQFVGRVDEVARAKEAEILEV